MKTLIQTSQWRFSPLLILGLFAITLQVPQALQAEASANSGALTQTNGAAPSAAAPAVAASAQGKDDLAVLFQREYAYLVAQKESLFKQQQETRKRHQTRSLNTESDLKANEVELARLTVKNDALFENVQRLEKDRRENQGREDSLKAVLKKSLKTVSDIEYDLRFSSPEKVEPAIPADVQVKHFAPVSDRVLTALKESSQSDEFVGAYRNAQGELVQSTVRRYGRIGAHAVTPNGLRVLAPSSEGLLTEIESVSSVQAGLVPLYVFESFTEAAIVKKSPRWLDRVANIAPGLMLAMLFALVAGLFAVLVRE